MKTVIELLLTIVLIVILNILAVLLSVNVTSLLVGIVCYLWAHMIVKTIPKED